MDVLKEIEKVQVYAPFLLITESSVEALADLDSCEERIATLGNKPFAVMRLLWTGENGKRRNRWDRKPMRQRGWRIVRRAMRCSSAPGLRRQFQKG